MPRFLFITFLSIVSSQLFAQTKSLDIPAILEGNKKTLALSSQDLSEYAVSSFYTTDHLNITHVYLEQRYLDIPVFNGILNLNLSGEQLVSFGNSWIPDLSLKSLDNIPSIPPANAIDRAAIDLDLNSSVPIEIRNEQNKLGQETKFIFSGGDLSREEIVTELAWVKNDQKEILLCWKINIYEMDKENSWLILIDAHSGAIIRKDNMIIHCDFGIPQKTSREDFSTALATSVFAPMPMVADSSYNVFAMPVESPGHGTRSIQTRPWLAAGAGNPAITKGWHNNGTTNYRITRGNNVHAYEDLDANNNTPGYSPDTSNLRFDYPYTPSIDPTDNLAACITNLFYWNNIIHDVMYQYGFNEVSGNFQNNNMSRGGSGADYVKAEAQDGSGTNNANFNTPVDGSSGRMQMYVWSPISEISPLTINTPPSIAGDIFAIESNFSANNKIANVGLITSDLVLVNDAVGMTHLGCTTIANAANLPGKIAVMDRGDCDFVTRVKNVQNLGAIAAIIINNVPGDPIAMGGTDNTIVIPSVMIGLDDGNELKAKLVSSTVNATLDEVPQTTPDGDFDSGIITHEYGHGISTRLTGGPAISSCLNNAEQMGEGWSDFFGLMLTTDWNAVSPTDRRGIGTYVLGQSTEGQGIRTYPYTTDMLQNPFTYGDVANSSSVHYIGSIWCTMLWDMTWSIIEMEGIDADMYHGTGGNNIALQLVMDGLKLQPCSPGFVDGRNAILLADQLNYGGAHYCAIWNAFAARGLGTGASQGSSNSYNDGVESFATPDGVHIESSTSSTIAGEGQDVTFTVKTKCECEGKSNLEVKDALSSKLNYIPGSGGTLNGNKVQFIADTLAPLDSVTFTYHAFVNPCSATATAILNSDNAETPDQYHTVQLQGANTKAWAKNTTYFVSPTRSWYAQDYGSTADYVLLLNTAVIGSSGIVEISFNHRYVTEAFYDGGTVEYSVNGGTTWKDAGPYFVENGYPSTITRGGLNIKAFSGNSDAQFGITGFLHSTIQIPFTGSTSVLVRFRMYCDVNTTGGGINGWYLDDIFIKDVSAAINKSYVTAPGGLNDSLYYAMQTSIFTGSRVYVDPSATGTRSGTSWANAMHYLPVAMDVAGCRSPDSVFVAQSTYLPNKRNDRSLSFHIPNNTGIFGGFPSGGSTFAMRNPTSYPTLLSGDVGVTNSIGDNVYHVLKVDSAQLNLLLDGVSLSMGNANGIGDNSQGAAVFCLGDLTMQNVKILNNAGATNGQLIRIRSVSAFLDLKDCTLFGPNDNFTKVLNTNGAELKLIGNTSFRKE